MTTFKTSLSKDTFNLRQLSRSLVNPRHVMQNYMFKNCANIFFIYKDTFSYLKKIGKFSKLKKNVSRQIFSFFVNKI